MKKKILMKILSIVLVCVMLATSMGAYGGEKESEISLESSLYRKTETNGIYLKDNEEFLLVEGKFYAVGSIKISLFDNVAIENLIEDVRISDTIKTQVVDLQVLAREGNINPEIEIFSPDLLPTTRASQYVYHYHNNKRFKSEQIVVKAAKNINDIYSGKEAFANALDSSSILIGIVGVISPVPIIGTITSVASLFLAMIGGVASNYGGGSSDYTNVRLDYDLTYQYTSEETYYNSNTWIYKLCTHQAFVTKAIYFCLFYNKAAYESDYTACIIYPNTALSSPNFLKPYKKCLIIGDSSTVMEYLEIKIGVQNSNLSFPSEIFNY